MKKIPIKLAFIFALIAVTYVGCKVVFPTGSWRYKITVEIETPEGIKSGSAVREVQAMNSFAFNPDISSTYHDVSGEAVVIDLGKRGVVFALIDWNSYNEFFAAFPYRSKNLEDKLNHYNGLRTGDKAILLSHHPKMVMFKDITDPKSVALVYVNELYAEGTHIYEDHFEEIFGGGVKLNGITVEITDEPVTRGIDKILPVTYDDVITKGWRQLSEEEKIRLVNLTTFKTGM